MGKQRYKLEETYYRHVGFCSIPFIINTTIYNTLEEAREAQAFLKAPIDE